MIAAPALGLHDRNSFSDSRKRLIQMANYLLTSATVAPSTRSEPTCSNLQKGRQLLAEGTDSTQRCLLLR
jgi:hypothetical protein